MRMTHGNRAYDQHDTGILRLPRDPLLRKLHADARLDALKHRVGLPEDAP